MAFTRVCAAGDVESGAMAAFGVDGCEVLVLRDRSGALHAFDGLCPHEEFPLEYGDFDGVVLTCANHMWSFDATTGRGINPPGCRLSEYAVKVEDGAVYVDRKSEPSLAPAEERTTP
jgi:toluene monooxygenase system ferredoxin subunit